MLNKRIHGNLDIIDTIARDLSVSRLGKLYIVLQRRYQVLLLCPYIWQKALKIQMQIQWMMPSGCQPNFILT